MGLLDLFRKKPDAPKIITPPPEPVPPSCSYCIAYYILPYYAFNRYKEMINIWGNASTPVGTFFHLMGCQFLETKPTNDGQGFKIHQGQLDNSNTYHVIEYPSLSSGRGLEPYFSAIVNNHQAKATSYYTLGQTPDGNHTTLRWIWPDGMNNNCGPGPIPRLDAFLNEIKAGKPKEILGSLSGTGKVTLYGKGDPSTLSEEVEHFLKIQAIRKIKSDGEKRLKIQDYLDGWVANVFAQMGERNTSSATSPNVSNDEKDERAATVTIKLRDIYVSCLNTVFEEIKKTKDPNLLTLKIFYETAVLIYSAMRSLLNRLDPIVLQGRKQEVLDAFDKLIMQFPPINNPAYREINVDSRLRKYFEILSKHFAEIGNGQHQSFNTSLIFYFEQCCQGYGGENDPVVLTDPFEWMPIKVSAIKTWWNAFSTTKDYLVGLEA